MFLANGFFFFLAVFTFLFVHHMHDEFVNHPQGGDRNWLLYYCFLTGLWGLVGLVRLSFSLCEEMVIGTFCHVQWAVSADEISVKRKICHGSVDCCRAYWTVGKKHREKIEGRVERRVERPVMLRSSSKSRMGWVSLRAVFVWASAKRLWQRQKTSCIQDNTCLIPSSSLYGVTKHGGTLPFTGQGQGALHRLLAVPLRSWCVMVPRCLPVTSGCRSTSRNYIVPALCCPGSMLLVLCSFPALPWIQHWFLPVQLISRASGWRMHWWKLSWELVLELDGIFSHVRRRILCSVYLSPFFQIVWLATQDDAWAAIGKNMQFIQYTGVWEQGKGKKHDFLHVWSLKG